MAKELTVGSIRFGPAATKQDPQAPATPPTADDRSGQEKARYPVPWVGAIVHYKTPADPQMGSVEWPAIITHVYDSVGGAVDLIVFGGSAFSVPEQPQIVRAPSVCPDPQGRPNTWHWPQGA